MQSPVIQRIRIKFGKIGPTRFIGHLDLARTWERALNRAKIPMAYTQGFNRRPRMQFASALQLGVTSECEYIDLFLQEVVDADAVKKRLIEKMAPGVVVYSAEVVGLKGKALPTLPTVASFRVELTHVGLDSAELQQRVNTLLAQSEILREKRGRKNKGKQYNLRPLIVDLSIKPESNPAQMTMTLTASEGKTGRPDELLSALEIDPFDTRIHRTNLILKSDA